MKKTNPEYFYTTGSHPINVIIAMIELRFYNQTLKREWFLTQLHSPDQIDIVRLQADYAYC